MKTTNGFGPVSNPAFLFGALALFLLSACATTGGGQDGREPSDRETVDVGYGSVDKDHVTGSVNTIYTEDDQISRSQSLAEMIQSRVPGVRVVDLPGGDISVRIRGTQSFLGGEEPLFVIDGMVIQGGLRGLNPRSIETITVLKDAGATAIYGSRGANGVILIKTKQGSE